MRSLILPFIAATIISTPATAGPKQFEFKGLVVGSKTAPAMVMAALGFGCDDGAKGMKVCNGPVNIGSTTTARANVVISPKGILQRIELTIPSYSFDNVSPALMEKYGNPDRASSPTLQNGFGVQ